MARAMQREDSMAEPATETPTAPGRAAVAFILVTVLLDVMALGLVIPVLPKLVESMAGSTQRAAVTFGVFGTAWALMQLVFSPIMGSLSDAYGRRRVLLAVSLKNRWLHVEIDGTWTMADTPRRPAARSLEFKGSRRRAK